jgi:hypothetical protein
MAETERQATGMREANRAHRHILTFVSAVSAASA